MEETLNIWKERLEKLGFSYEYYNYFCDELIGVDWYKDSEHIETYVHYTDDYNKYIQSLKPGSEYNPDWNQCVVDKIIIHTQEFAYPRIYTQYGNKFKGAIILTSYDNYTNFVSLTYKNFRKSLYMSQHPIESKTNIVKGFIQECELLFNKYKDLFESLNFKQTESSLLLVGYELSQTEPYICFKHPNKINSELVFNYNMFTNKLVYANCKTNEFQSYVEYELINVNDISYDEFKYLLNNFIKN